MTRSTWLESPAAVLTTEANAARGGVVVRDGRIVELVAGREPVAVKGL